MRAPASAKASVTRTTLRSFSINLIKSLKSVALERRIYRFAVTLPHIGDWRIPFLSLPHTIVFVVLIAAALFVGNGSRSLWDQDEAAYAGFGRTMLRTGDWIVPTFAWSEVHRKTPLLFWSIGASFAVFGENEFALRLPTVLAVMLTFVSVAAIGGPLFGRRVAYLAAAILATMVFIPNLGKIAVTDSLVLLFETVAALSMLRILHRDTINCVWPWALLFWSSVALGTLAKGPMILVVAGGLGLWLTVFHPRRRQLLLGLQPWFFLPVALLPVAAWGYQAWRQTNGELIQWMIHWYGAGRATRSVYGQGGPPGTYLVTFFLLMLPWAMFIPSAFARLWKRRRDPLHLALTGWLASAWLVWEFAASKLPAYVVGAYPAFALLFALEILDPAAVPLWKRRSVRIGACMLAVISAILAAGLIGAAVLFCVAVQSNVGLILSTVLFTAILCSVAFGVVRHLRQDDVPGAARLMLFGSAAMVICAWGLVIPRLEPMRTMSPHVARHVQQQSKAGAQVDLSGSFRKPSLPFYLGTSHPPVIVAEMDLPALVANRDSQPRVLVLDEASYATIQNSVQPDEWRTSQVTGFNFDRCRNSTFWILVRDPSRSCAAR